uniref:Variant surface glycoprotein 1125.142 n=1 Tax=Trypanosoma brucei TaxID=5691 RepID=M4SXX8_9TRYP|nr:variant surface glycoprotein 358 [Trypanosoma brucei]APD72999.1 variant surface glycoprotein 1125.142 [Trypanosoma brucei]
MTPTPKATADLQRILILCIGVLFFGLNLVDGNADDNAGQHHVMCLLSGIANSQVTAAAVTGSGASAKQIISSLNMSTSSIDWQKMFDTTLDDAKGNELPDALKDKPYAPDWKTHWSSWWKAAKHVKDSNIGQPAHELYKPIKSYVEKAAAHKQLRQLTLEAETLTAAYQESRRQAEETQKELAESKLKAALYGGDGKQTKPGAPHTRTAFTRWDAACTVAENGKSIVGDFFCLCTPDDGQEKTCANGYTPAQWNNNIAAPDSTWNNLQGSCATAKLSSTTSHDIRMAIGAFLQALTAKTKTGTTKTYLGTSDDGTCTGASTKLCVDYTDYFSKKPAKTYKDIPWLKSLEDAVTALENMHKQEEKANNLDAQLANLLNQANLIYTAAANGDLMTEIAIKAQVVPEGNPRQNVNCAQHNNNKTCVSPCKWESKGDKGTCKLDESKVKTPANAGTGEQTSKCTGLDTKERCEGVQGTPAPGKKSVCGWITYEDGKGTLDKPYCRDSSFLVNKQFALSVVSAAFAALLF